MLFYGTSFMRPYKQPVRRQDVFRTLYWFLLHRYITMHGSYYIGISQCTVLIT
jgi:hypothetical protein